jgi:hypothetical protein
MPSIGRLNADLMIIRSTTRFAPTSLHLSTGTQLTHLELFDCRNAAVNPDCGTGALIKQAAGAGHGTTTGAAAV